jgi:hypothetical protein
MPDLEERVAALEARLAPFQVTYSSSWPALTEEETAELKDSMAEAAKLGPLPRLRPPDPPPLTPGQVRQLLSECVTVVKPGEHLILRVPWSTTPTQVRELQDYVNDTAGLRDLPFNVLILPGDELAVAEPEQP